MSLRSTFKAGVSADIYTNTQRLIKGNTVRDKFLVMADDVIFIDQVNVGGGFLGIDVTNLNVDISFIKAISPSGKFLKDDGSWSAVDAIPSQATHSGQFLTTSGSALSWISLTTNPIAGTFLFNSGYGIDSRGSSGTDVLNIGATNADVINYGNSATVHNFLGTAIYELQVNSYVQDKVITLNYGGGSATGIGVGFEIQEASSITGYFKTNEARNGFSLKSPAVTFMADLNTNLLTAARAYSFPNVAGTFLLGSLADSQIGYGSSGVLTGSNDFSWNGTLHKVNGSTFLGGPTDPSAWLQIAAGTATKPFLKLTEGVLLTTAQKGAMEQVGIRLYFTGSDSIRRTLAYTTDFSAAGSDGSIQYNSGGSLAASSKFLFASNNLKLDGSSLFGMSVSNEPTAFVDIGSATSARSSLRIRSSSGTSPVDPKDGEIWYDGSFLFMRMGGTNMRFNLMP